MAQTRFPDDVLIMGDLHVVGGFVPAEGSIDEDAIAASAKIPAENLIHRHNITWGQPIAIDAASEARVIYRCDAAGGATIVKFAAGAVVPAGATTTITVDLKKNGVSILSSTFDLDSGNAAYAIEEPSGFTSPTLVEDDILSAHLTLAGSNEPKGVFVNLIVDEQPISGS